MIPLVADPNFTTDVVIRLDGRELYAGRHGLGDMHLSLPLPRGLAPGRHKVSLTFSALQRLPRNDGRPVSVLLKRLEFVSAGE